MDGLKKKVEEFAEIAEGLPENLQVVCFELLLRHHLGGLTADTPSPPVAPSVQPGAEEEPMDIEDAVQCQEDLTARDLHTKVKRFLEKYSISLEQLNNVFYKEKGEVLPLYEDLGTTRMSEGQIRVALFQALRNAITGGDFSTEVECVRQECIDRKCYDTNNFAAHFRNNKSLFDFDSYTKSTKSVKLSEDGRKELAQVIKELQ